MLNAGDQIFDTLRAAEGFTSTLDQARRREAQVIVNDLTPRLRQSLYDGLAKLQADDSLSPGDWLKKWDEERDGVGLSLFGGLDKEIEAVRNPYARQELVRQIRDDKFQIRQQLQAREIDYTNKKTVAAAAKGMQDRIADPTADPNETAAYITEQLTAIQNIMDPHAWNELAGQYRKIIAIDALLDTGRRAKAEALKAPGANPATALPAALAALDQMAPFTFLGEAVPITPELVEEAKKKFTSDFRDEVALYETQRNMDVQAFTDKAFAPIFNPAWSRLYGYADAKDPKVFHPGLYALRALLTGDMTKEARERVPEAVTAAFADFRTKYGEDASALLTKVEARINALEADLASGSSAQSKLTPELYKTQVLAAIESGLDPNVIEQRISEAAAIPGLANEYKWAVDMWKGMKETGLANDLGYQRTLGKIKGIKDEGVKAEAMTILVRAGVDLLQKKKRKELSELDASKAFDALGADLAAKGYAKGLKDWVGLWGSGVQGLYGGEDGWEAFKARFGDADQAQESARSAALELFKTTYGFKDGEVTAGSNTKTGAPFFTVRDRYGSVTTYELGFDEKGRLGFNGSSKDRGKVTTVFTPASETPLVERQVGKIQDAAEAKAAPGADINAATAAGVVEYLKTRPDIDSWDKLFSAAGKGASPVALFRAAVELGLPGVPDPSKATAIPEQTRKELSKLYEDYKRRGK